MMPLMGGPDCKSRDGKRVVGVSGQWLDGLRSVADFYGELCEIFDEASIASSINPSNCCVDWSSEALWL